MGQAIMFVALLGTAIWSGTTQSSIWWLLLPAFLWASLNVSNHSYNMVMTANREGRLSVMPRLIGCNLVLAMSFALAVRWFTGFVSS